MIRRTVSSASHTALSVHVTETVGAQQLVAWSYGAPRSLLLVLGEAERRDRFAYALQEALRARGMSERQLAVKLGVDPRKIARWRNAKAVPDYYETLALAETLGVREDLFRNPPAVPVPPVYPIGEYLITPQEAARTADLVREAAASSTEDFEAGAGRVRVSDDEPAKSRRKRSA